ncbi:MAG: hypothetical protein P1P90_05235 [Patescibacteria group bacterium]|nr:hypothetical protein [Patescibacteria group bacterium]
MPTIRDVMDTYHRASLGMEYFGCTPEWKIKFEKLVTRVGHAISMDIAFSHEIVDLSPNVELGPLGLIAFQNLRLFIEENSVQRTDSLL